MDIGSIYAAGLLDELKMFANSQYQQQHNSRVLRIYNRLMRTGHAIIAQRLADKYPNAIHIKSDAVMAFAMSLMAQEKLK